jgi:hypothetical protein
MDIFKRVLNASTKAAKIYKNDDIMDFEMQNLIVDIQNIDPEDICSCWQWRLQGQKGIILISKLGDMFMQGEDDCIYWLQTDSGDLTKVADSIEHFEHLLSFDENLDNWFLPGLVERLVQSGKVLKQTEVYSYKVLPVIGGEYSIDNIEPTACTLPFPVKSANKFKTFPMEQKSISFSKYTKSEFPP